MTFDKPNSIFWLLVFYIPMLCFLLFYCFFLLNKRFNLINPAPPVLQGFFGSFPKTIV